MCDSGTAIFTDKDGYLKWYNELSIPDANALLKAIRDKNPHAQNCAYQMFETYAGYYGTSRGAYMRTWKATTYTYTDKKGRKKNVLIPNVYPNFKL